MRVTSVLSVSGRNSGVLQHPWLAVPYSEVEAAAEGAVLTLGLLLGGHIGLFALAAAGLLAHRATTSAAGVAAAAAFAAAALSLSNGVAVAPVIEPWLLDSLGSVAVLLQALRLAATSGPPAPAAFDAHKLAALNHELRTPLNAIIGFAGLMRSFGEDARLAARCRDYARIIETSGAHMLGVLEAATGGQAEQPCPAGDVADIDALIAETIELTAPQASRHAVSVRHLKRGGPVQVNGDRRQIRQILLNLTANAIKFSPPGADVGITVNRQKGGGVEVAIADQGMGIAGSDVKAIGTPYWRGQNAVARGIQGSGLGLSICRRLAENLGGNLSLESREGSGATARLELPALGCRSLARQSRIAAHSGSGVNPVLAIGAR